MRVFSLIGFSHVELKFGMFEISRGGGNRREIEKA